MCTAPLNILTALNITAWWFCKYPINYTEVLLIPCSLLYSETCPQDSCFFLERTYWGHQLVHWWTGHWTVDNKGTGAKYKQVKPKASQFKVA